MPNMSIDLSPDEHIEFSYLRLDQTGVEFPGQIFDMRFLVTDAYELRYTLDNQYYFDHLSAAGWYNRTRFEGDAQNSGKRRQIPQLNCPPSPAPCLNSNAPTSLEGVLGFTGHTDVDAASSGYSVAVTWGDAGCPQFGHCLLRMIA